MLPRFGLAATLVVLLIPAALAAAGPETCSCEYCLANLDAKCRPPDGTGTASCAALVRSGACLGQSSVAESETPAPARTAPVLYEPLFAASECCTSKQQVDCRKQCNQLGCFPRNLCGSDGSCVCLCRCPV